MNMKRFLSCLLILTILVSLVGCAKLIKTEYTRVDVEIVDSYHRSAWIQPIWNGKTMMMIPHPATYRIDVEYNDVEYSIHGSEIYEVYKDRIGEVVSGTLEISTYDDGTIKYDIVSLGDE